MTSLLPYLPFWLFIPTSGAIAIQKLFWNADEALNPSFRHLLTEKIKKFDVIAYQLTSLKVLQNFFNKLYNRNIGQLPSIFTVSKISIILSIFAVAIDALAITGLNRSLSHLVKAFGHDISPFIGLLLLNIAFDYISAIKAVYIIEKLITTRSRSSAILFICIDIIITTILVWIFFTTANTWKLSTSAEFAIHEMDALSLACIISAFLTSLLSLLFVIAQFVLGLIFPIRRLSGRDESSMVWSVVVYVLPVDDTPMRAIGVVATLITFISLLAVEWIFISTK